MSEDSCARFPGAAEFWRNEVTREVTCERADPLAHIPCALVNDDLGRSLIEDIYVLRERCPRLLDWHAVVKERPLPRWTNGDIRRRETELRQVRHAQRT